jgi:hypothetical protein
MKKSSPEYRALLLEAIRRGLTLEDEVTELLDTETMPAIFGEHRGQQELWEATARFVAAFAGWQSGKTTVGPPWLLREMQRKGPGDYAVIAPNHPLLDNKALPELLKWFRPLIHRSGNEWFITDEGAKKLWGYVPEEPARILLRHAMRPEAIEAFTAKAIWVDEPGQISDVVWEAIQARVAVHQGRVLLTSRPYEHNWYVKEFWRRREEDPNIAVVNFRSVDNPAFSEEEYERVKAILPDWKFKMKYDGIPTRPAGAIYDCFDRAKHTCKRFSIPKHWKRFSGHDFGAINTAAVFAAQDPATGILYLYGTYAPGQAMTTTEHASTMLARQGLSEAPAAWGGAKSESQSRMDYTSVGYPIMEPPLSVVFDGIAAVYGLIKRGLLIVFDDLNKLIADIEDYSYELDDEGEPIDWKIQAKETWHRLDALRYLCSALYMGLGEAGEQEPQSRFEKKDELPRPAYKRPSKRERELAARR